MAKSQMKTDVSGIPEQRPPTGHSQSKQNCNSQQIGCKAMIAISVVEIKP